MFDKDVKVVVITFPSAEKKISDTEHVEKA